MKQLGLLLLFVIIAHAAMAQQTSDADSADYDNVFTSVRIRPKIPGSPVVWQKFLQRHGLQEGTDSTDKATAIVSFLVDKKGHVSEVAIRNEQDINKQLSKKIKHLFSV